MSKEKLPVPKNLSDIATIDFEQVFQTAVGLFSDQAMLKEKDISKVTIKDLEAARAKSDSFLESIGHIFEISNQVELLQADSKKFKREDELNLLHSLRRSCQMMAEALETKLKITVAKLGDMEKKLAESPDEVDIEQLIGVQAVMQSCVDTSQKLIASSSRLIQAERFSGLRPWGHSKSKGASISTIEGLDNRDDPGDARSGKGPRPLQEGEID